MNQSQWIKKINVSELVPILDSRSYEGAHVSMMLSGTEFEGKRPRSMIAALIAEIDKAEYYIRKTKEDSAFLNPFREWIESMQWLEENTEQKSYAFFVSPAGAYWLQLKTDTIQKTESIVAETWHLKPLLNLVTKADAKAIRHAIRTFKRAQTKRRASDVLDEITQYAVNGQVKTLMVSSARKVWGELNRWNGKTKVHSTKLNSHDDDLLDDLAEIVMRFKGNVLVVPDEWMPTVSPVAAVLK